MEMTLLVAVIAAAASICAAVLSLISAASARRSAEGIDRRRHAIESHDRQEESFRNAYVRLMEAVEAAGPGDPNYVIVGRILARAEVLRVHPWTNEEVDRAAHLLTGAYMALLSKEDGAQAFDGGMLSLRAAARRRLAIAAADRQRLLER